MLQQVTLLPVFAVIMVGVWGKPQLRTFPDDTDSGADRSEERFSDLQLMVPMVGLHAPDRDERGDDASYSNENDDLSSAEIRQDLETVVDQLTDRARAASPASSNQYLVHNHDESEPCPICELLGVISNGRLDSQSAQCPGCLLIKALEEIQDSHRPVDKTYRQKKSNSYNDERGYKFVGQRGSKGNRQRGSKFISSQRESDDFGQYEKLLERKGPPNVCRRSNVPQDVSNMPGLYEYLAKHVVPGGTA